jgi:hypothetical protein
MSAAADPRLLPVKRTVHECRTCAGQLLPDRSHKETNRPLHCRASHTRPYELPGRCSAAEPPTLPLCEMQESRRVDQCGPVSTADALQPALPTSGCRLADDVAGVACCDAYMHSALEIGDLALAHAKLQTSIGRHCIAPVKLPLTVR